jgi:predicted dehydrogenase
MTPEGKLHDGWSPPIPEADQSTDYKSHGYKSLEELVRWRLYNRTGGGLMAELGSHQLDACSLFLGKVHPVAVSAIGGKYYFTDDRECDDHVYCTYHMPNGVVITYSSINTNALEGYGEVVMGTKGTLMVLNEADVMLFKEREPQDPNKPEDMRLTVTKDAGLKSTPSTALPTGAALARVVIDKDSQFTPTGMTSRMTNRGYREELAAFAYAIRNPDYKVRCDGRVALADAVMALASNVAMKDKTKIDFNPDWYDPTSDAVPDTKPETPLAGK